MLLAYLLHTIIRSCEAPPVPTSPRVGRVAGQGAGGLWVHDDNVVEFRHLIVTSKRCPGITDSSPVHVTAM